VTTPDWSVGHYEQTAAQLLEAAEAVIELAAPAPGEHVVDVGCGTGNAALLAAERGAEVTGVDPAERLRSVAEQQAQARGLSARFVHGTAEALPLAEHSADLILSVFGVIFASDAAAAIAEMARVVKPSGRIVLSAWIPEGAISAAASLSRRAVMNALGSPEGQPPFPWHEAEPLAAAFAGHGFEASLHERSLAFTAESASAYLEGEFHNHPLWISGAALLEPRGELAGLRQRVLEVLEAGNEDPDGFRVTSRYVIAVARPR
jgi:SAM-dependent methyltransferase